MSDQQESSDEMPPSWALELRDRLANDPDVRYAAWRYVTRDMPVEALDRIYQVGEEGLWSDIAAVLTVYDEHVEPAHRGPWRHRLASLVNHERGVEDE